jgi:hypothetical protein
VRHKLSVIFLNKPLNIAENIARFDFGACMAAFDGENVISDPHFEKHRDNKTFTLYRADNYRQFEYSMSRWDGSFKARFPHWKLNITEEFRDFECIWWDAEVRKRAMINNIEANGGGRMFAET